jgi:phosphohistidine swiveling domain-containing protein
LGINPNYSSELLLCLGRRFRQPPLKVVVGDVFLNGWPVATDFCAPAALWAVEVDQAGRLGQAEADLVDQSAVVAVDPVVPAVVEVDQAGQTVVVAAEVDLVDQSAVVAVDPVVPAVVEVDQAGQTVVVAAEVDPVDQPQAQARESQTEDLS